MREVSRGSVLPARELQRQIATGFGASLGSFDCTAGAIRGFQAGEGQGQILLLCVPSRYQSPGGCLYASLFPVPHIYFINLSISKNTA